MSYPEAALKEIDRNASIRRNRKPQNYMMKVTMRFHGTTEDLSRCLVLLENERFPAKIVGNVERKLEGKF